jgi:hypothetical protein
MALMLFIVSRDDPALYRLLREEFADESEVHVILDRRFDGAGESGSCGERRKRPEIDERLHTLGWAIVHPDRR